MTGFMLTCNKRLALIDTTTCKNQYVEGSTTTHQMCHVADCSPTNRKQTHTNHTCFTLVAGFTLFFTIVLLPSSANECTC